MKLAEIKTAAQQLSDKELQKLTDFLNCLAVTRDPEWQRAMQYVAERREFSARARKAVSRRGKTRRTVA